ncbi:general secretion pathway protein K [Candidatus Magnetoovum chiemensis]|nr:general secretion pathway protein K [Candidatus Magnetoovum chiemensis]
MAVAIITALAVDFTYEVFVSTNLLYNYKDSQNLSVLASSGIMLSIDYTRNYLITVKYTTSQSLSLPIKETREDAKDSLLLTINDENSKLNINSIIYENGTTNEKTLLSLKLLLRRLSLDETLALYIADWIDTDKEERISDSENSLNNRPLRSLSELTLIKQITPKVYDKIKPFITVYGNGLININTAPLEVLMSMDEEITETLAKKIIDYRNLEPFSSSSDIMKAPSMEENIGARLIGRVTVKSSSFFVISEAQNSAMKKQIHAEFDIDSRDKLINYWREY